MAISSETTLKKPKVVEESDSEDSEDSAESDAGQMDDELSAEDTMVKKEVKHEIKKEVEEEAFTDEYNNTEEGFVDGFVEVKDEEESDGESSSYEDDKTWKKTVNVVNETKEVNNESESSSDGLKDIDDNFGDDESEQVEESDEEEGKGSSGLANVMAKILASKKSDDVILSKAKTDKRTREKVKDEDNDTFEIVDGSGQVREVKKEPRVKTEEEDDQHPPSLHSRELQRKVWEQRFRVKPKVEEDREKERHLRVLATQGVVQLFSAIEKHRSMVQKKLSETRSVMGREKILETTGKEAFLEILKQQGRKVKKEEDGGDVKEELKEEVKEEPLDLLPPTKKTKWNVFAENFYKEPTLHGWDQKSDDEG